MSREAGPLEVVVVFEPNRLAADHLAAAYERVVPIKCRRPIPEAGRERERVETHRDTVREAL